MKLDHYLISYTNINSKWIRDLNIRLEMMKFLEENIGGKLLDISLGDDFLTLTQKVKAAKVKINKRKHQIKKLLHSKENQQNIKRQSTLPLG